MPNTAHEQLLEQLKPVVNEPEFDQIFAMLTADMSGPERFQLKSELRRLAAPCNRQVDLRKRVVGDVQPYMHKGVVHYMDSIAISIFEDGLERYQGVFTQDTYDRIFQAENNYRVIAEKDKRRQLEAKRRRLRSCTQRAQSHYDRMVAIGPFRLNKWNMFNRKCLLLYVWRPPSHPPRGRPMSTCCFGTT